MMCMRWKMQITIEKNIIGVFNVAETQGSIVRMQCESAALRAKHLLR